MIKRAIFFGTTIAALLALSLTPVLANTATHFKLKHVDEDSFYNYDFCNENAAYNNVDWAVDMIFWDNADVDKVKNIYWGCAGAAVWKHFKLDDGGSWEWDKDRGTKHLDGHYLHMRVYAPHPGGYEPHPELDRFYNDTWGYYVLGTCHWDEFPEIPGVSWHGYSESAEGEFCEIAEDAGYTVDEDAYDMENYEASRWEGTSFWNNGGHASKVQVP